LWEAGGRLTREKRAEIFGEQEFGGRFRSPFDCDILQEPSKPYSLPGNAMETATMGRVQVAARLENLEDVYKAAQGTLPPEQVRAVEVTDALIDTGATGLLVPRRLIAQLGLPLLRRRPARTIAGSVEVAMYRAVRLTVQGRDCISDVGEIGDEFSVAIGQVPLELMDWVVDPKGQRLMGNPEHGGEQMIDII
jgi:predicted aspartyl protease